MVGAIQSDSKETRHDMMCLASEVSSVKIQLFRVNRRKDGEL